MPRVSVIVPLYNKVRYVARALDSIYAQDYRDFELIVVDDGSTDGSRDVVQRYEQRGMKLVTQPNSGPGAARNRGVGMARGEIVAFLDADDAWYPFYLSESLRILDECGPEVPAISWTMQEMPGDLTTGRFWDKAGISGGLFRLTPETSPHVLVMLLATLYPPVTVMRKAVFDELGGFYGKNRCRYSEDAHLWLKLLLKYPWFLHKKDGALMYVDAAQLSANHTAVRPIEPFLTDPEDILTECPRAMQETIRVVLATRALKTAAVYGYWGHPAQSRKLLREFVQPSDWRLPYFVPALVGCTPVGGWIGALARGMSGFRSRANGGTAAPADSEPRAGVPPRGT
jgi:hypothetical protein